MVCLFIFVVHSDAVAPHHHRRHLADTRSSAAAVAAHTPHLGARTPVVGYTAYAAAAAAVAGGGLNCTAFEDSPRVERT
jgi:hypothetical protein